MDKFSYVGTSDVNAIESLFLQYNQNPDSVDASWRDFFKGFEFARTSYESDGGAIPENVTKEFKVLGLINGLPSTRAFVYQNKPGSPTP